MQSTLALKETDPHDIFVIEPDVVLAARADQPSRPKDAAAPATRDQAFSDVVAGLQAPSLDAPIRAAAMDNTKVTAGRSALRKWAGRATIAFLFALCSAIAAAGWKHYGETAKAMAMNFAPKFVLATPPPETSAAAAQPDATASQATVADHAVAQPTAAPQPSADAAGPAVAAPPADSAQSLQAMAQQIEQLKTTVDQLKASQDQMARDIARNAEARAAAVPARTPESNQRPKPPAPRTAALPARKPRPAYPSVQAAAPPLPPVAAAAPPQTYVAPAALPPPSQATVQPDGEPVVRPPMPLH